MTLTPADIITALGTLANVGLLTGIFFKLGTMGQSIVDMLRRLETLENDR